MSRHETNRKFFHPARGLMKTFIVRNINSFDIMKAIKASVFLGFTISLTACGGGGNGGSNGESNNGNVSIDPANSLYTVSGTVTGAINGGLTLENNGGDSLQVTGTDFEFSTQLTDGANYDVTIAAHPESQICSATNTSGAIAGTDVDNIEVHCRHWGANALIENTNTGNANFPQLAADSNGNIIAAFLIDDDFSGPGAIRSLYVNYFTASTGTWGTETLIETGAGLAGSPDIAFDNNGNAMVVWFQDDGTNYSIYSSYYTASTDTWGTEEPIESVSAGNALEPQVVFDSSGNAIAVWQQNDGTYDSVYANVYTAGTATWGTEELIESGNLGNASAPQITIDDSDNVIAAWSQSNGVYNDIFGNNYTASTGWGTATLRASGDNGNGGAQRPQIAFDANGDAMMVWDEYDGAKTSLYAIHYTGSTDTWGTEVLIENGDNGNASNHHLAVDNNGNAMVIWTQNEISNRQSVYANRYNASTDSWGSEILLENNEDGSANSPKIAVDADGNALVVWTQDDNTFDDRPYTNRYIASTDTWGTAAPLENTGAESYRQQLVMDNAGNATAVFAQFDGTSGNILVNRFE